MLGIKTSLEGVQSSGWWCWWWWGHGGRGGRAQKGWVLVSFFPPFSLFLLFNNPFCSYKFPFHPSFFNPHYIPFFQFPFHSLFPIPISFPLSNPHFIPFYPISTLFPLPNSFPFYSLQSIPISFPLSNSHFIPCSQSIPFFPIPISFPFPNFLQFPLINSQFYSHMSQFFIIPLHEFSFHTLSFLNSIFYLLFIPSFQFLSSALNIPFFLPSFPLSSLSSSYFLSPFLPQHLSSTLFFDTPQICGVFSDCNVAYHNDKHQLWWLQTKWDFRLRRTKMPKRMFYMHKINLEF